MDTFTSAVHVNFIHTLWWRMKLFNRPGRHFVRRVQEKKTGKKKEHFEKSELNHLKCSTFTVGDRAAQTRFLRLPA